jgi:hypothetical protein
MRTSSNAIASVSRLQRIRALSHLLDDAISIPGTPIRFGIDAIIGLLPIGGDMVGVILSAYIVLEASRFGLSRSTLIRMVINLLLDGTIGCLPILGDMFDVTWKANLRNVALLDAHLAQPQTQRHADRRFVSLLLIVLALLVLGAIALIVLAIVVLAYLVSRAMGG